MRNAEDGSRRYGNAKRVWHNSQRGAPREERVYTMKTTTIFTTRTTLNECSKGLEFVSNRDGTCFVSGIGTCTDTDIKIPSVYDGKVVTSIGESAFRGCKSLTSITIPDSVVSIGNYTFAGCKSLTSITIPDSVVSIGHDAFHGCTGLTSITIPDGVTSIGKCAFCSCVSLASIMIPDSVTSIGNGAFSSCYRLASIAIPDSVTNIGNSAFEDCSSLKRVAIPNSVIRVGDRAFFGCTSLTSVTIPDSVKIIGERVFYGCDNLKSQVKNYKAFDLENGNLSCRCTSFSPKEWSDQIDDIELCRRGYHYCTNLFDIFNYYFGEIDEDIAIYECEVGDVTRQRKDGDSKHVTNKIKPVKRLYREDIIRILNGQN